MRLTRAVLLSVIAAGVLIPLARLAFAGGASPGWGWQPVVTLEVAGVLALVALRWKGPTLASWILSIGGVVVLGVAVASFDRIGPFLILYGAILVVVAATLLSPGAAGLIAAALVALGGLLLVAGGYRVLGMAEEVPGPAALALVVVAYGLILLLLWLHADRVQRALGAAHRELAERREAEQALIASEQRYADLVATVPGVVYQFRVAPDGSRSFPFMSAGIRKLIPGLPADALDHPALAFQLVPPEFRDQLDASIAASMARLTPWKEELPIRLPDGSTWWIGAHSVPHRQPDGGTVWHGVMTDVTVAKQTELALRESERQLQASLAALEATLESTADGILVIDHEGLVSGYNRKFLDLWGLAGQPIDRRPGAEVMAQLTGQLADPAALRDTLADLDRDPEAVRAGPLEGADGRAIEYSSQPQSVGGRTAGRVWSFRDVTDARRASDARRELESKLFQAQKMEAVGTLAGGIAHDFNNILTAIVSHADLARLEPALAPAVAESVEAILGAAQRAKDLIGQILLFSRARPPEIRPVELGAVVDDTLRLLRSTVPKAVEFGQDLPGHPVVVRGDPAQLHQVVMNLGLNAAHALSGRAGSVRFRLAVLAGRGQEAGADWAVLDVTDTGTGMDRATLARIFEPFFTTKPAGQGSGLGLSVVHSIVEQSGGRIAVDSTPGQGTRVEVRFPLSSEPAADLPTPDRAAPGAARGERILLVDDEPEVLRVTTRLLGRLGYVVAGESDPARALARVEADPAGVDLVLTDLSMPGMSGLELAAALQGVRPGLPVVLATGYDQGLTLEGVRGRGIRALVAKPFTIGQVAGAIQRVLAGEA